MAEGASNKDVIYVDVDDEITGIIDKVRSSSRQIVALVIPKRSTVLQSIVNMKLLKRSADRAKKNIVLITGDEGLLPLAGNVGLHVARNLQSRPEIPKAPAPLDTKPEVAEESVRMDGKFPDEEESPVDKARTLGELSGAAGAVAADDAIELDNDHDDEPEQPKPEDDADKKGKKEKKPKKNKALMVPNFNRFRSWLFIGAAFIVVLIILLFISLTVLPKATITVDTNSQRVPSNLQLTLSSDAGSVDTSTNTVPSQTAQTQKTYTGTANTTGQQNNGQDATGTVDFSMPCRDAGSQPTTIPAGTGVSADNLTFITDNTIELSNQSGSIFSSSCTLSDSTTVTAQNGGSNYNIQPTTFTVPGQSDVTGTSSQAFTGGTDDITQIVAQADVTNAQSKINTDTAAEKSQLESDLQSEGLVPIQATFTSTTPNPTPSTAVGQPASTVTVSESITYTMQGVRQSDLQTVVATYVKSQISTTSQKILDYGLSNATFTSQGANTVNMQDTALVGFALDQATIKRQVAGKKPGTAESAIRNYSGVTNTTVHLSPFWVSSIPKNTSKITVNIVNPNS